MKTIEELRAAVSDPRAAASLTVLELQRLRAWGEYERTQKAEARARAEWEAARETAYNAQIVAWRLEEFHRSPVFYRSLTTEPERQ